MKFNIRKFVARPRLSAFPLINGGKLIMFAFRMPMSLVAMSLNLMDVPRSCRTESGELSNASIGLRVNFRSMTRIVRNRLTTRRILELILRYVTLFMDDDASPYGSGSPLRCLRIGALSSYHVAAAVRCLTLVRYIERQRHQTIAGAILIVSCCTMRSPLPHLLTSDLKANYAFIILDRRGLLCFKPFISIHRKKKKK